MVHKEYTEAQCKGITCKKCGKCRYCFRKCLDKPTQTIASKGMGKLMSFIDTFMPMGAIAPTMMDMAREQENHMRYIQSMMYGQVIREQRIGPSLPLSRDEITEIYNRTRRQNCSCEHECLDECNCEIQNRTPNADISCYCQECHINVGCQPHECVIAAGHMDPGQPTETTE